MDDLEAFKAALAEQLVHLYDPLYCPEPLLWRRLGFASAPNMEQIRSIIVTHIEQLKSSAEIPLTSRSARIFEILSSRYLHERTQKATALRLSITPRHLRREQQEAIHWLALQLWEGKGSQSPVENASGLEESEEMGSEDDWREQVQRELLVLQQNAPGIVADVGETLHGLLELTQALTVGYSLQLVLETIEAGVRVALHPSILRQVAITAVEKMAQQIGCGTLTITVSCQAEMVHVNFIGVPNRSTSLPQSDFIQTILAQQGGSYRAYRQDEKLFITLELPQAGNTTVLVVDDNVDLVHFYRRYTEGTQFQIKQLGEGSQLFRAIEESWPDIIVLDVMLPDVDGWKLLIALRNHPRTATIPIIVCSVVRREELAKTLGAKLYLTKPVRRQEFIRALEAVLPPSITSHPKIAARSAATSQMSTHQPVP